MWMGGYVAAATQLSKRGATDRHTATSTVHVGADQTNLKTKRDKSELALVSTRSLEALLGPFSPTPCPCQHVWRRPQKQRLSAALRARICVSLNFSAKPPGPRVRVKVANEWPPGARRVRSGVEATEDGMRNP